LGRLTHPTPAFFLKSRADFGLLNGGFLKALEVRISDFIKSLISSCFLMLAGDCYAGVTTEMRTHCVLALFIYFR
jgi:hypothetical protein